MTKKTTRQGTGDEVSRCMKMNAWGGILGRRHGPPVRGHTGRRVPGPGLGRTPVEGFGAVVRLCQQKWNGSLFKNFSRSCSKKQNQNQVRSAMMAERVGLP